MLFVGIDPGLTGALAFYRPTDNKLHVYDLPVEVHKSRKGNRKEVDVKGLVHILQRYCLRRDECNQLTVVVIEDVGAMVYTDKSGVRRGQGARASFTFGKVTGILHGILATLPVTVVPVKPAVWKLMLGLSSDKILSRTKATFLFPQKASHFIRMKDDGRAEAALLAWFGYVQFTKKGEGHGTEKN